MIVKINIDIPVDVDYLRKQRRDLNKIVHASQLRQMTSLYEYRKSLEGIQAFLDFISDKCEDEGEEVIDG